MSGNICGPNEYFDGLDDGCVHCSVICSPDLPQDFCRNNCPGYTTPVDLGSNSVGLTSPAATNVLTSVAYTLNSSEPASLVAMLLSLLVVTLTIVILLASVVVVVFVVLRRRNKCSPATSSVSSLSSRRAAADSQGTNADGDEAYTSLMYSAGNDHRVVDETKS